MYKGKKVIVVMPAYNAAKTLEKTFKEIPFPLVDEVVLCDDASKDNTKDLAREIGINHVIVHEKNKGWSADIVQLPEWTANCYEKCNRRYPNVHF